MAVSWNTVNLPLSAFRAETMILLTDGSVLVHSVEGKDWLRLTPDDAGDYASGTWSSPVAMAKARLYFASGVLKDGRVYAVGGEVSDPEDSPLGEIFDPLTNVWSPINKPESLNFIRGDASSCVLADGRVLFGNLHVTQEFPVRSALWDPSTGSWYVAGTAFGTSADTKVSDCNEETWTLLPDGSVLTVEVWNAPAAERYVPSLDRWISAGRTPQSLVLSNVTDPDTGFKADSYEIGPAILLSNGNLLAIGATGHTAIYTPDTTNLSGPGQWTAGPDFPAGNKITPLMTAIDAPACLLPNGKVICVAGQTVYEPNPKDPNEPPFWSKPTTFFMYDPSAGTITPFADPPPSGSNSGDTYVARLLILPTGQVLYSAFDNAIYIYTPDPADGTPDSSWKPVITSCPRALTAGQSYAIEGTQLNGLSQANSYGDDAQMATNFPLVRATNVTTGLVRYLRTSNFSTMGVAMKATPQSARFQVPKDLPGGSWSLAVVANGIASDPVTVQVTAPGADS